MLTINRNDRIFLLLFAASFATLVVGVGGIMALSRINLSDALYVGGFAAILFGMWLLQERLVLILLTRRGYLCRNCRTRSIVEDTRRVIRGHRCACGKRA
jgi:cytochrome c biogenesis protein CcdA